MSTENIGGCVGIKRRLDVWRAKFIYVAPKNVKVKNKNMKTKNRENVTTWLFVLKDKRGKCCM
jgi:hypothetical protein